MNTGTHPTDCLDRDDWLKTSPARRRVVIIVVAVIGLTLGAIAGAWLNWIWWEIGYRPLVVILGLAILMVGGIMAMIRRWIVRRSGLVVLAVGLGLLAGQSLGPSREPLINQWGGTMTLRLESPNLAVLTGTADCTNVASETEFLVHGSPDSSPGQLGLPGITAQLGDRWSYPRDTSRTDRVRLEIVIPTHLVPGSIKVLNMVGMEATESSTLAATFTNEGGLIRFSDLGTMRGEPFTGESIDLAGAFEWTCGPAPLDVEQPAALAQAGDKVAPER
ncbi:MAG: hypothetical protein ACR2H3_02265 [Acidimicrobiales bacterium]